MNLLLKVETSLSIVNSPPRVPCMCYVKTDNLYLDTLHRDVVDDADDATRPGHGQQRMARVGVVGPGARVEVLVRLRTS